MALAPVTLAVRLMMQAHLLAKYFSAQLEFPDPEFLGIEFQIRLHTCTGLHHIRHSMIEIG